MLEPTSPSASACTVNDKKKAKERTHVGGEAIYMELSLLE